MPGALPEIAASAISSVPKLRFLRLRSRKKAANGKDSRPGGTLHDPETAAGAAREEGAHSQPLADQANEPQRLLTRELGGHSLAVSSV